MWPLRPHSGADAAVAAVVVADVTWFAAVAGVVAVARTPLMLHLHLPAVAGIAAGVLLPIRLPPRPACFVAVVARVTVFVGMHCVLLLLLSPLSAVAAAVAAAVFAIRVDFAEAAGAFEGCIRRRTLAPPLKRRRTCMV